MKKSKDTITAEELDSQFDEGKDIAQFLDWNTTHRPGLESFILYGAALLACTLCGCNGKDETAQSHLARTEQQDGAMIGKYKPPENLDEALAILMANLTPERRAYIESGGEEFAFCAIDYTVLPPDLPFLDGDSSSGDSTLSRYFLRKGIFDGEDMWYIINTSFSRKVRDQPIELGKQIAEIRQERAAQDEVSPLDLNCPHCGLEMDIEYALRISSIEPRRKYFIGHCQSGPVFFYYHKYGWKPEGEINDIEAASPGQD